MPPYSTDLSCANLELAAAVPGHASSSDCEEEAALQIRMYP